MFDPPIERVEFPYQGTFMAGWLRKPRNAARRARCHRAAGPRCL
jgi:hypothetical protein